MKFKEFIVESHVEDFKELLKGDYSQAYANYLDDNIIYKGFSSDNFRGILVNDFTIASPLKDRKASDTLNFCNLMVSNFNSWKEYPQRNNSFVGSTSKKVAEDYGTVKLVFPKNNANIGICSASDFYNSFEKHSIELMPSYRPDIPAINYGLNFMLRNILGISHISRSITFIALMDLLNRLNDKIVEGTKDAYIEKLGLFEQKLYLLFREYGVVEFFEKYLDPSINGFSNSNVSSYAEHLHRSDLEVWTDSECLIIDPIFMEGME